MKNWMVILSVVLLVVGGAGVTALIKHSKKASRPVDTRVVMPSKVPQVDVLPTVVRQLPPRLPKPRPKTAPPRRPCSDADWFAFKC